jgi:hypothetical protein
MQGSDLRDSHDTNCALALLKEAASDMAHNVNEASPPTSPIAPPPEARRAGVFDKQGPAAGVRTGQNLPVVGSGRTKRAEHEERDGSWNIAIKRGIIKALPKVLRDLAEPAERALSQVRAWVEHLVNIVKNLFRQKKMRYRGLAKNTGKLHTLFALANVVIVKQILLAQART